MTYDNYGNIVEKNGKTYTYDYTWKDLLTSYDGQSITYDAQGNPLTYLGHTLTWEKGRQLKSFDDNTYTYNANGIRTSKTVDGITHTYILDGTKILRETWCDNTLVPLYDNEDSVCGILYNNTPYYFIKNLQGDVIAIVDKDAQTVARYSYDAWGVCTVTQDSVGIATINPFRYRGYYFDEEIGLYYLQSRYYDAGVGRFINVDGCFAWDVEKSGFTTNFYVYCENNPINQLDVNGNIVAKIIIRAIFGALFGAAMQYLADVLQNLLDCAIDKKKITQNIWKTRSGIGDYISAIVSGAVDATLKIGVWKSIGVSFASTIVGHLVNWIKGKGFSFNQLIKDLVWNALLALVTDSICKKFMPKQGKQLNQYIRERFKVKGNNAYRMYWNLLRECVEWNGYILSTFVNTLRSASRRILDFVEVIIFDCIIMAFDKTFAKSY